MDREVRITRPARRHLLSAGRIREALAGAVFDHLDGEVAIYHGVDSRGLDIELGLVPDDRGEGMAVVHAMPAAWRKDR